MEGSMSVATLTSKGQITLPKDIREHLKVSAGDEINFVVGDRGEVRVRPMNKSLWDLRGRFKRPGERPITLEEMDDAIARGAARLP
jgi:AbrB family looped-hinge helix DNA binding protein